MTWRTNAWKSPRAKHETGEQWCLQCGADGRPERAAGVDEDGEPACGLHRVQGIGAGLNAAAGAPGVPAPIELPPIVLEPIVQPAAAPSPVQTSAVEVVMSEQICGGFEKACGAAIGAKNSTGLCPRCYARKHYRDTHPPKARKTGGRRRPVDVKPAGGGAEKDYPQPIQFAGSALDVAKVLAESDPYIVVRIRQSHVGRLLGMLLA